MRRPLVQNTNKLIKAIGINENALPNIIRKAGQLLSFPYKPNTTGTSTPLKIIQKIQKQKNKKLSENIKNKKNKVKTSKKN